MAKRRGVPNSRQRSGRERGEEELISYASLAGFLRSPN